MRVYVYIYVDDKSCSELNLVNSLAICMFIYLGFIITVGIFQATKGTKPVRSKKNNREAYQEHILGLVWVRIPEPRLLEVNRGGRCLPQDRGNGELL